MDVFLIIVLFALFSVVTDRMDKKKRPPQTTKLPQEPLPKQMPAPWPRRPVPVNQEEPLPFKIPELRNAPMTADEAARKEKIRQQEEEYQKRLEEQQHRERRRAQEQRIRAAEQKVCEIQAKIPRGREPRLLNGMIRQLTPESAQQAVVLAEILGRPKAYRR